MAAMHGSQENGQWVTLAQAAAALGVSARTLRRQVVAGQYRTQRVGKSVRLWLPQSRVAATMVLTAATPQGDGGQMTAKGGVATAEAPIDGGHVLSHTSATTNGAAHSGQMAASPADNGSHPDADELVDGSHASEVDVLAATVGETITAWQSMLDKALDRASRAEQAAAMWQERAHHLEGENSKLQELLALPAHEEPLRRASWWQFWRRGTE